MTWATENPVVDRAARSAPRARARARSARCSRSRSGRRSTSSTCGSRATRRAAQYAQRPRRVLPQRPAHRRSSCLGPGAQHDAARRADRLHLAGRAARARRPDRAHRSTCTTTSRAPAEGQQPLLQTALWLSLLRACSGFEAFMRRQQGRVSREAAVSFLLFEARFPRSLRYCVRSALALARRLGADRRQGRRGRRRASRLEALDRWLDSQAAEGHPAVGARAAHPRRRRGGRRVPGAAARRRGRLRHRRGRAEGGRAVALSAAGPRGRHNNFPAGKAPETVAGVL